jgi:hypothetical protein
VTQPHEARPDPRGPVGDRYPHYESAEYHPSEFVPPYLTASSLAGARRRADAYDPARAIDHDAAAFPGFDPRDGLAAMPTVGPYPPPVRVKRRVSRWLIVCAVVLVMVAGAGAVAMFRIGTRSVSDRIEQDQQPARADVTLSACTTDPATKFMTAAVTITNHGDRTADYLVAVAFETPGRSRQLDSAMANANRLDPGRSVTAEARTITEPTGRFVCLIADVSRT